jgi:hypothetical protein
MLVRARVSAWLARQRPWTAVIGVGSMAMTVYLWHLTAMVLVLGLVLAVHGPLPAPGTATWWATRPLWLALLAAALVPMTLLLSRFERPRRRGRGGAGAAPPAPGGAVAPPLALVASPGTTLARRPARGDGAARGDRAAAATAPETAVGRLAVIVGLVLAASGLLGFVVTGFAPALGSGGGAFAALHLDPLQNLVHLVVGAQLAAAAGTGASARPGPWLLLAAGCALPAVLPAAGAVTLTFHLSLMVLALLVAATRPRPSGVAMRYNSLRRPSGS